MMKSVVKDKKEDECDVMEETNKALKLICLLFAYISILY